jgi:hypothetical protein
MFNNDPAVTYNIWRESLTKREIWLMRLATFISIVAGLGLGCLVHWMMQ